MFINKRVIRILKCMLKTFVFFGRFYDFNSNISSISAMHLIILIKTHEPEVIELIHNYWWPFDSFAYDTSLSMLIKPMWKYFNCLSSPRLKLILLPSCKKSVRNRNFFPLTRSGNSSQKQHLNNNATRVRYCKWSSFEYQVWLAASYGNCATSNRNQ